MKEPEVAGAALPMAAAAAANADCPRCAGEQTRVFRPGVPTDRVAVTSPQAAAAILCGVLEGLDREHAVALLLDSKHRLLNMTTVSIGTIDRTFLDPREVYRDALLGNASALVLAHNHPSGDPTPSNDDLILTRRLAEAGDLIGIELLDHIIMGHDQWVSLATLGIV